MLFHKENHDVVFHIRNVNSFLSKGYQSLLWISHLINVKYSTLLSESYHIVAYSYMLASMLFIYFKNKGLFLLFFLSINTPVKCFYWQRSCLPVKSDFSKKKKRRLFSFSFFWDINEKPLSGVIYVNVFHLHKHCRFHINNE